MKNKKKLLIIWMSFCTCIFCLNFISCNKQTTNSSISIQKIENKENKSYSIDEQIEKFSNYSIKYPIFINFEDKEKETMLNELIKKEITNMIELYKNQKLSNIEYIITNKNDLNLSILYTAQLMENSYPQQIIYPINIDINNNSLEIIVNDIKISNYEILNVDNIDLKQSQLEYIQSININDYLNKYYRDYENNVILIIPTIHDLGDNIYLKIIN